MMKDVHYKKQLDDFDSITLAEMDTVKLMNRTDTKFLLPLTKLGALLEMAKEYYRVCEIDGKRELPYSTTYLDTPDHLFFNQHMNGRLSRHKMRYRTYLTSGITFFEIKCKTNKERTVKWRIPNKLSGDQPDNEVLNFMDSKIDYDLLDVKPALINHFSRITLVGLATKERITIDFNLEFKDTKDKVSSLPFLAIAELKREGFTNTSPFIEIARKLSIRRYGFSKYCIGSALLNDHPKTNILKPKFLILNKIQHEFTNGTALR